MEVSNKVSLTLSYLKSSFLPAVKKAVVEVTMVVAASIFLKYIALRLCLSSSFKPNHLAFHIIKMYVADSPLKEEIRFRGVFQRGIALSQMAWNAFQGKKTLSQNEILFQERIRIHASAILFGLRHIKLERSVRSNLVSFTWTYLAGLNYGYLSEKYKTLSLGIVAHGFNNAIGQLVDLQRITNAVAIPCIIALQVSLAVINLSK
jgi:membrane protease YdiL (CAAX protease family)